MLEGRDKGGRTRGWETYWVEQKGKSRESVGCRERQREGQYVTYLQKKVSERDTQQKLYVFHEERSCFFEEGEGDEAEGDEGGLVEVGEDLVNDFERKEGSKGLGS